LAEVGLPSPTPLPEAASASAPGESAGLSSTGRLLAVMASTFERLRLRLPSELGCAPGAFTELPEPLAEDEAARKRGVLAGSLDGLGVP